MSISKTLDFTKEKRMSANVGNSMLFNNYTAALTKGLMKDLFDINIYDIGHQILGSGVASTEYISNVR
jgi:hypothetical protein